jgi:hypothetical protein
VEKKHHLKVTRNSGTTFLLFLGAIDDSFGYHLSHPPLTLIFTVYFFVFLVLAFRVIRIPILLPSSDSLFINTTSSDVSLAMRHFAMRRGALGIFDWGLTVDPKARENCGLYAFGVAHS